MQVENSALLECCSLSKKKGDFLLSDIQFSLPAGYLLGVIGRNGAGKTTLTRLLLGSYTREVSGDIRLNGVSITKDVVAYKKQIAFILNESPFPETFDAKTCGKIYGSYYEGFDIKKYMDLLKEFQVPFKVRLRKLSRGQQIKQQLAFALSYKAKLYVLDEPTANLDVEFRQMFYQYIRQLTEDGGSVIYVSHLVDELEQMADYILWLQEEKTDTEESSGQQKYFGEIHELKEQFQLMEISENELAGIPKEAIVGSRIAEHHQELLVRIPRDRLTRELQNISRYPTLKELMYYVEKGCEE